MLQWYVMCRTQTATQVSILSGKLCGGMHCSITFTSAYLAYHLQVYKDDNHKPEMAIALTDFEALCGFVEHGELVHALTSVPELRSVVGEVRQRLAAGQQTASHNRDTAGLGHFTVVVYQPVTYIAVHLHSCAIYMRSADAMSSLPLPHEVLCDK